MGILEEQHAAHEERLRDAERRLDEQQERLEAGDARMNDFAMALQKNNDASERIEKGVKEILSIFTALKGFVTVGGWLGTGIKWAAGLIVAAGVVWLVIKTGDLPTPPK